MDKKGLHTFSVSWQVVQSYALTEIECSFVKSLPVSIHVSQADNKWESLTVQA